MDLYITAFLDILGQREKLKPITLKEIKTNQINSENIVKNLAHQVLLMRESFASYFNSWNIETPDMLNITEKEKKEILKSREENILFQGFSDSVCISVLLDENDFYFKTMKSINSVFLAISTIFYKALINKYCLEVALKLAWV